jgi:uncharacterized membrane protein SpoIIM required for sporulation
MDIDAFVAAHQGEWDRLDQLVRRRSRLTGAEVDELVVLYQRATTHLSMVRTSSPDPALIGRLTSTVSRARGVVTSAPASPSAALARFVLVAFPLAAWRTRWWTLAVAVSFTAVAAAIGAWVAGDPGVQAAIASPEEIRQLVEVDFEAYYSSEPAGSFAARVWTNNAWIAALSLVFGGLLGLPVLWVMLQNALNVGISGGLMASADRLDLFFGLILPHGLLELTAVFVAAGAGLRLGWTIIDPGPRLRGTALGEEGRATFTLAIGLLVTLLVSGVVEAFVTPSGLPTAVRIGIGVTVLGAFLAYVGVLGARAERLGLDADLGETPAGDGREVLTSA